MKKTIGILAFLCLGLGLIQLYGPPPLVAQPTPRFYQRIVSLAPSFCDTLKSLHEDHRLVGIVSQCQEILSQSLPVVGSFGEPSFEAILNEKPDLVLLVPHVMARHLQEKLEAENILVFARQPDTLEQIRATTLDLARLLGKPEQGIEVTEALDEALAIAKKQIERAKLNSKRILITVAPSPLVVAGKNTFPGQVLEALGFNNYVVESKIPWPIWSLEALIQDPPDFIMHSDGSALADAYKQIFFGFRHQNIWKNTSFIMPQKALFQIPSPLLRKDIQQFTSLVLSVHEKTSN